MLSSAELVLWAIHHATTLLFGVFASAALCGVEINRRHSLELVGGRRRNRHRFCDCQPRRW